MSNPDQPHPDGRGWEPDEPSPTGPRPGWEQHRNATPPGGDTTDSDPASAAPPWGPGEPAPAPSGVMGLPVWTRMDPAEAREAWAILRGWLAEVVFTRYDELAEAIRPCWYRHAEAVEQLSWLCAAWRQAYLSEESSVSLAGEWHIRWAPSVRDRVKTILKPCSRAHSTNPHEFRASDHRPDDGYLDAFIDADLVARDTHYGSPA